MLDNKKINADDLEKVNGGYGVGSRIYFYDIVNYKTPGTLLYYSDSIDGYNTHHLCKLDHQDGNDIYIRTTPQSDDWFYNNRCRWDSVNPFDAGHKGSCDIHWNGADLYQIDWSITSENRFYEVQVTASDLGF